MPPNKKRTAVSPIPDSAFAALAEQKQASPVVSLNVVPPATPPTPLPEAQTQTMRRGWKEAEVQVTIRLPKHLYERLLDERYKREKECGRRIAITEPILELIASSYGKGPQE